MRLETLFLAGTLILGSPVLADGDEPLFNWPSPPYWTPTAAKQARSALAASPPLPFIALTPCRIIDTRGNAPLTGGFLPPATVRSYTVTNVCGIPPGAQAVSLNATVVHPTGPGFLTLYPEGGAFPPVSTLNYVGSDVVVNAAVVPLSGTGGISMALGVSGGDVILDTNGYYAPQTVVSSLNGVSGDVTLAAGANVTLTPSGSTLTIASAGGGGGAPTGPAGGGLNGTYPNPGIAAGAVGTNQLATGAVTDAKVASGIAYSKLAGVPASLPPSGAAGGSLGGNYPNPTLGTNSVGANELAANAVTAGAIAPGQVVKSVNGLKDAITLNAGPNVTITPSGNSLTIGSAGVLFAGSGSAPTASHSDHQHLGAVWNGPGFLTISTTDSSNPAVHGVGQQWGLHGTSNDPNPNSAGVLGETFHAGGNGVFGMGGPGTGVRGTSTAGNGVYGLSSSSGASGVYAENTAGGYALAGRVTGSGGFGTAVLGETSTTNGRAIYGRAVGTALATGWAGLFEGKVEVVGTLTKAGGSFKIDHPLDPGNKYLYHSFVESPDMMNIYNGIVATDATGYATVELPEWFEALNRDFRYQLTVLDESDGDSFVQAKIVKGVSSKRFSLRTSAPHAQVSWQLTGIRKDAWAESHRIPVEEVKSEGERGRFLHPMEHGRPPADALLGP